jgi:hypothetical protein
MARGPRKPPQRNRRGALPPPIPVMVAEAPPVPEPQPVAAEPAGETDMTEDAIRKMLEAAYT